MDEAEIWSNLNEVFKTVFGIETPKVVAATTADQIDGWDSLSHIKFILAVEKKFEIKFQGFEVVTFENVGDLVQSILAKTRST